ncbi:uncharacterized protein K452DRAFT_306201 [Aplosporella prunicola CBS 121167]|uniref:Uncharacterized protein n=1 Tax=Aplosporella prunicola CBS 121167 TaxID=1176127 RepID=A0A6A6BME1_9PEZI|nr:uncharacterized protein K452DRAFT_306201 [Aplosporella prunicola CBS 121167]KAF2145299.1 hypothetical protein K452DRAFT_306201 [Aplosporella prunicola CBS 121167]
MKSPTVLFTIALFAGIAASFPVAVVAITTEEAAENSASPLSVKDGLLPSTETAESPSWPQKLSPTPMAADEIIETPKSRAHNVISANISSGTALPPLGTIPDEVQPDGHIIQHHGKGHEKRRGQDQPKRQHTKTTIALE